MKHAQKKPATRKLKNWESQMYRISKLFRPTDEQRNYIRHMLLFYDVETMAAAERISDYLETDYKTIFDLL